MIVPCSLLEGVRDILREDTHRMLAVGHDAAIMHALEVEFTPKMTGQAAGARFGKARLPFVLGQRRINLTVVVRFADSRASGEVGKLAGEHIQLHRAALYRN